MAAAMPYVSRKTVMQRAKTWYDAKVTYSQLRRRDGYRTDCSGYVSMTWGLGFYLNTISLGQSSVTHRITKNELKPGDILLNTTGSNTQRHVVLFERWANAARTRYLVYEQSGPRNSPTKHHVIDYPYPKHPERYVPRRYNRILERGDVNADGFGDVLGRTKSGKLYQHLNRPGRNSFAPRSLVSGDWDRYKSVVGGDLNRDGYQDVLARDRSGRLYRYLNRPGHNAFRKRVLVSRGWNAYSAVVSADLNGDGYADLLARSKTGTLYRFLNRPGRNSFAGRVRIDGGWNAYSALVSADVNRDGYADLLARSKSGRLYLFVNRRGHNSFGSRATVSDGWGGYRSIVATDINGDGYDDLLTQSTSGNLYQHLNTPGRNTVTERVRVDRGWTYVSLA